MMDRKSIKEFFKRQSVQLSEREVEEKYEQYQSKIREERCKICHHNFSEEDIQTKKYTVNFSCPPSSENGYYHSDCLELKKEEKANPLLFAKVRKLEQELNQLKK